MSMSSSQRRAAVLVAAVATILVVACGSLVLYLAKQRVDLIAELVRINRIEGRKFGETTDERGCVKEALLRFDTRPDEAVYEYLSGAELGIFFDHCLRHCRLSRDLCDRVPPSSDPSMSLRWIIQRCSQMGAAENFCRYLFMQVQTHCESAERLIRDFDGGSL